MKQKVCKVFIALMSLLVLLGGCKNERQESPPSEVVAEQTENSDIEITKEYLCSEFDIDESEFEGVDFEDFVNENHLTYESVQRENVRALLHFYKFYQEEYENIKTNDYSGTFNYKTKVSLTENNQEDIVILIFSHYLGLKNEYYIFDFEMGKIMFGVGVESMVGREDIVGDADETVKQSIISLFEKYDVYSWEQKEVRARKYYSDVMDGGASWSLGILFADDTIYWLYGETLNDETAPESLDLFLEDLKALAPDSEE